MKTSWKKNKKILAAVSAVLLGICIMSGVWSGVYAQAQDEAETQTGEEAVQTREEAGQTEVEVDVKYILEDDTVFMEEKIKAEIGQILDSGDLPMLQEDMEFADDFLFYEVKGDGTDAIIRKVAKILTKDKETQTEEENQESEEAEQQPRQDTSDQETQTDLSASEIENLEDEVKRLGDRIDELTKDNVSKDELNKSRQAEIESLKDNIKALEEKLKNQNDGSITQEKEELGNQIKALENRIAELQADMKSTGSVGNIGSGGGITHNITEGGTGSTPYTGGSTNSTPTYSVSSTTQSKGEDEQTIRYPNKLTPDTSGTATQNTNGTENEQNTNKGVASKPSTARGMVTENVDNANNDYPIHHGDETDDTASDMYSADARQFLTFQTKSGKTFYLIIDHDEDSENVMLLTEVSEDDLLNMVETKEEPAKKETVPQKEISEPVEKPEKEEKKDSNLGTYIILVLVVAGALGGGYYFKVVKNKEKKELENLEEEDDFFSESEESGQGEEPVSEDDTDAEEADGEEI